MERKNTRQVVLGNVKIGGNADISVQSMLNIPASDTEGSVRQSIALEKAGCDIIRIAIPDADAIKLIPAIKKEVSCPLVADIHFDYKLALEAAAAGIDKIRINPGNIGDESRVKQVADECRRRNIPIRIGVNSGSLEKHILAKYGRPTPQALCDSALYHASLLEKFDFDNIVLSMKSSDVDFMVQAYKLASDQCDYPLHLGVTEAGTERMGLIKSSIGIGSLLLEGIGDTIRVSVNIREGNRERIQMFEGTVIAKRGSGVAETFTVRRVAYGVGVERVFPLHSPNVKDIKVVRYGKVRRSKLYYLRDRVGKAAKVKEQIRK